MQTQPNTQAPFPIQELEQIDCTIQSMQRCLEKLNARRETLIAELEHITRPRMLTAQPHTKMLGPGLQYRGVFFCTGTTSIAISTSCAAFGTSSRTAGMRWRRQ